MEQDKKLIGLVEKYENLIYETADHIFKHPETGYREWKTSAYMAEHFEALGYTLTMAGNIPGFYADLDTGRPGPKIAILGELDSLIVANHPDADPETSAVHACGHNAQCAVLLGVTAALKEPGALDGLCGSIRLMSVPAEELIELGFREELRKQGIIKYFGGKVEFISRGYFDGVDIAMMIHSGKLEEGKALSIGSGCNGCVTKNITFKGVSAHAGGSPQDGKNALYAATCGLNAVNAIRETFVDDEHIRFHPIITQAGLAVNAIPEIAKVESYVRGASYDSIYTYNKKVNQALAASAASIGCNVEIDDHPGYFPLNNDKNLAEIMTDAMEAVAGPDTVTGGPWGTGSTDMGDVSAIMPAIHPHASGSIGTGHGKDYYVADKKLGCLYPAECLVLTAARLLSDDAALAKKVIAEAKPYFKSKEEYLAAIDRLTMDKDAVIYNEDGTITLDFCK
ncbi:MAG: amidohydrolase [Clostridiales bacterium]|nr:amidohydrolase [Clostridiales bacterium]